MSQQDGSETPTPASSLSGWLYEKESERSDPRVQEAHRWAMQAAIRLREALSGVPFYAKRAEQARLEGNEMDYWLGLQGSEATLRRP